MCGIAGIVDFAGRSLEPEALATARAMMRHRGPDDFGTWTTAGGGLSVAMAATRLAVLDPSPGGHQPMTRDDGRFVMVFNGLIYNYRELGAALTREGVRLSTSCDTEVALAACALWGRRALERFNGMFALAFYDRATGSGFLARDRFGIKPLLWVEHENRLMFASEMRALRGLGDWPGELNRSALMHYLRFGFVAHPETIYECAHRLPPACCLPFDERGVGEPVRYYSLPAPDAGAGVPDRTEAAGRVRRALFESVARRRVADVPVGAFLSGGLDSSIIVAHLAQVSSRPVQTFSVGWKDERAYDETRYARLVADRFGTDHHELKCDFAEVLGILPAMLDHLGEPFFDSSILPTAMVSAFARRHVTVALSGDGGDELFGGYWRYLAQGWCDRYERIPGWMRRGLIEPLLRAAPVSKTSATANRLRQFRKLLRGAGNEPERRHLAWCEIMSPEARDIVGCEADGDSVLERLSRETLGFDPSDRLSRILAFDLQYSLPCDMLHKVDLASMFHSLEVRVPFLDPEVVAAAMSLPSSFKVGAGGGKAILKEAYADLLPAEVLARPKAGFEAPIGEFLRRDLREMFLDTVSRDVVESFGVVDHGAVMRVYDDHCARRGEHADLLFALLSLCWWRRCTRAEH